MAKSPRKLKENRARYRAARVPPDTPVAERSLVEDVIQAAARSGLIEGKGARISARVSPALIKQAKRLTGIDSDTRLIEYALATIALEDPFPKAFIESRGTVDPTLKLDFFEY